MIARIESGVAMMIHDFSKMIATQTAHQGALFRGCGDHGDHFAKYPPHFP